MASSALIIEKTHRGTKRIHPKVRRAMSRWTRTEQEEWAPGFWKFTYRDLSYDPGDATWLFLDERGHDGHIAVRCTYDSINSSWFPSELALDAVELIQRWRAHHLHPLEHLAAEAE